MGALGAGAHRKKGCPVKYLALLVCLPALTSPSQAARIIFAKGEVELQRDDDPFRRTGIGELLREGDLLRPGAVSEVRVLCDNGKVWLVPSGAANGLSNGCPSPLMDVLRGRGDGPQPGGGDPTVPYVITPRMTRLLDSRPTLRWNPVSGAKEYELTLFGPGGQQWPAKASAPPFDFPSSWKALAPGAHYVLRVSSDNGKSSDRDPGANLGFSLLTAEQAERVQEKEKAISKEAQPEYRDLARADLYIASALYEKAIPLLQDGTKKQTTKLVTLLVLGELYERTGLNALAGVTYKTAQPLAEGDPWAVDQVASGAARVASRLASPPTASFDPDSPIVP